MFGASGSPVASLTGDKVHDPGHVDGPPISPYWSWESQAGVAVEQPHRETNCPIRSLASQIDSCAKARVIALLAMEFLVFDGKLHGDRSNWACPFGDCKENFSHAKALMRHVAGCSLVSGDKVYCNSCRKHDCFALQGREKHLCNASHDASVPSKTSRGLRKLTTLFSRGRPASTSSSSSSSSSSPGPHHAALPGAASSRPTSTGSDPPAPPPQAHAAELGAGSLHEIGTSAARNYPGGATDMIPELASPEPLNAGHLSHPSLVSATRPSPMYSKCLTESPVDEVNARGAVQDWLMPSEIKPASLQTISPDQIHPSWAASPPSAHPPRKRGAEPPASWGIVQPTPPPGGLINAYPGLDTYHVVPPSFSDSIMSLPDASWEATPFAHQKQRSSTWPKPETLRPSSTPHQARAWPWKAPASSKTGPGHAEPPLAFPRRDGEASLMLLDCLMPCPTAPPEEAQPPKCHYCEYRPGGKRANWRPYLRKHIHTKHSCQKVVCAGCGKDFSRLDNLKTHQKSACRKTMHSRTPSLRAAKRPRLQMGTVT